MADYKEGVDFKWIPSTDSKGKAVTDGNGKPVLTRKFFTKAEKAAMKAPKAAVKTPKKSAVTKAAPNSVSKKVAEKAVSKDAMAGYRKGDVTTSKLGKVSGGRGDGGAEVIRRRTEKALANVGSKKESGSSVLIPAVAAAVASRKQSAPKGKPYNPSYSNKAKMAEGFQGRYATEVGAPKAKVTSPKIGTNPTKMSKKLGGGRRNALTAKDDFKDMFLN